MSSRTAISQFRHGLVEHAKDLGFILNIMRKSWRILEGAPGSIRTPEVSFWHLGVQVWEDGVVHAVRPTGGRKVSKESVEASH